MHIIKQWLFKKCLDFHEGLTLAWSGAEKGDKRRKGSSCSFFQSCLKKKKTAQKSWPCHNSNIVLGFIGLLRSPEPIKCVWDSQLIRQAPGFSLQKALSQFISVTGTLKKRGQKLQGLQGQGGFLPYVIFFINQKRLWAKPLPHIKFQSVFKIRWKAVSPHFRKEKLEEAMGRRCLQNITNRVMLQIRASTSSRLPSNALSTMKHWPPTFQGISKANYTFRMNIAGLAIKEGIKILHVIVPLLSSYQMMIWTHLLSLIDYFWSSDHLKGKTSMMNFLLYFSLLESEHKDNFLLVRQTRKYMEIKTQ